MSKKSAVFPAKLFPHQSAFHNCYFLKPLFLKTLSPSLSSLIFQELIRNIKISLLITVSSNMPVLIPVQIREVSICLILVIDLGHMSHLTIRQHLTIDALSSDDIDILFIILLQFLQKLIHRMNDNSILYLIFRVSAQNNVGTILLRQSLWESLQCLTPQHYHFAGGLFSEMLMVIGYTDKQLVLVADRPIVIYCYD